MPPVLAPRKAPRQARSRKTRDAILRAAGTILAREGLRGLTTNHVARAAGISIGSLYQYYPNKQAIISALLTESRAAVLAGMEAAADGAEDAAPEAVICAMVRARLRQLFDQPALAEALERAEAELPADHGAGAGSAPSCRRSWSACWRNITSRIPRPWPAMCWRWPKAWPMPPDAPANGRSRRSSRGSNAP